MSQQTNYFGLNGKFTAPAQSAVTKSYSSYLTAYTKPAKPHVFEFKDPLPLRCDNWDCERLSKEHNDVLLAAPDGVANDLDTILKDDKLPVLAITGSLYNEIRYLVEKYKFSELAMFLTLKKLSDVKPHWLAFDFFMPGQDATSAGVSLDGPDCDKYFEAVAKVPYYEENGLHRNLCHLHSHAQFGTFWSGVDDHQQFSREDMGFMDDYRLYVVVNAAGSIKCSLVIYKPVCVRIDAAVVISYSSPERIAWLTNARKKELDAIGANALRKCERLTSEGNDKGFATTTTTAKTGVPASQYLKSDYDWSQWDDYGYGYDWRRGSTPKAARAVAKEAAKSPAPNLNQDWGKLEDTKGQEADDQEELFFNGVDALIGILDDTIEANINKLAGEGVMPEMYENTNESTAFAEALGFGCENAHSNKLFLWCIGLIHEIVGDHNAAVERGQDVWNVGVIDEETVAEHSGEYVQALVMALIGGDVSPQSSCAPSEKTLEALINYNKALETKSPEADKFLTVFESCMYSDFTETVSDYYQDIEFAELDEAGVPQGAIEL